MERANHKEHITEQTQAMESGCASIYVASVGADGREELQASWRREGQGKLYACALIACLIHTYVFVATDIHNAIQTNSCETTAQVVSVRLL